MTPIMRKESKHRATVLRKRQKLEFLRVLHAAHEQMLRQDKKYMKQLRDKIRSTEGSLAAMKEIDEFEFWDILPGITRI